MRITIPVPGWVVGWLFRRAVLRKAKCNRCGAALGAIRNIADLDKALDLHQNVCKRI